MTERLDTLRAQLLRGGVASLALKAANAFLQLVVTIMLARILGVSEFGIYAYVFATVSLISIPAQSGLPTLIVRFTSTYQANSDWAAMSGLWCWSRRLIALASLAAVLLATTFFVLTTVPGDVSLKTLAWTLVAALLIVPLRTLAESRAAALRGLGRIGAGQVPDQLVRPLVHLALVAAWTFAPAISMTAPVAMALHAVGAGCSLLVATLLLSRLQPIECRTVPSTVRRREWRAAMLPLSLLAGAQAAIQQTDHVMLGVLAGVDEVGFFRVAAQGAAVVGVGLLVATTVMSPHVARLHATGSVISAQRMITWSARVVGGAAAILTAIIGLVGSSVIEALFGASYAESYVPMIILCCGLLIKSLAGPAGAVLTMTGHERDALAGVATATAANILLNALLIPRYGIVGASLASALAFVVWSVSVTRLAYRRTGFDTTVLGLWRRRGIGEAGV